MTNSIPAALKRCDPDAAAEIVAALPAEAVRLLNRHFPEWAHRGQAEPRACAGSGPGEWRTWVLMAGRGYGKTRAGAEWVMRGVRSKQRPPLRIALVAASLDEARRVMVEGPSGILAVAQADEVRDWSFARRRVLFASGAQATLFSGAHPDGLRGPEHDLAWCDELAKWRDPQAAWDNLQLGLRRGTRPRALVTTTPRRGAALSRLLGEDNVVTTGGPSSANPHLPWGWVAAQAARLGGELMKRQELNGELIEEVKGALWTREMIEASRVLRYAVSTGTTATQDERSFFSRIVVGVDPPASAMGDACGIVVCGLDAERVGYVLADCSAGGLSPEGWARKVAGAAAAWGAQMVVAEANNGGEMIAAVLRAAEPRLKVRLVHARANKVARATGVAALFEGGFARFAGRFPQLEDELAGLSYDEPYAGPGRSPDRADAMVWAMDELRPGLAREPGLRTL